MNSETTPLPERIRPRTLDEVIGQQKLIGPNGALRRAVAAGRLPSMIYGDRPALAKQPSPSCWPKPLNDRLLP